MAAVRRANRRKKASMDDLARILQETSRGGDELADEIAEGLASRRP